VRRWVVLLAAWPAVAHADEPAGPGGNELRLGAVATATDLVTREATTLALGPGIVLDLGHYVRGDSAVVAHLAWTTFDQDQARANLFQAHIMAEIRVGRFHGGIGVGVDAFRATEPVTDWTIMIGGDLEAAFDLARTCDHAFGIVFDVSGFTFNPIYHALISGKVPDQLFGVTASAGIAYRY
jgi:hypothetical protein